jgi:Crp-like helix-turn-helix protein
MIERPMSKRSGNEDSHQDSGSPERRPLRSANLIASLEAAEADAAAELLASCPSLQLSAGAVRRPADTRTETLCILEEGFIVVRSLPAPPSRPMITCEAAYGGIVLPPAPDELVEAILESRLTLISEPMLSRLLLLPGLANALVREVAETLRRKQDSIANFGNVRHSERVRRKLLQLAREYGRVTGDGVRLDLPLTHALLAEMIGSERETVTRAVEQLERVGLLSRNGHHYRLHVQPEALAQ